MYFTSVARVEEREEILGFLEMQGLEKNAWLLWDANRMIPAAEDGQEVIVCRAEGKIMGVAYVLHVTDAWLGTKPDFDFRVHMDAVDIMAVEALLNVLPEQKLGSFWLFNPMIQDYMSHLDGVETQCNALHYTVSRDQFKRVQSDEVVELTAADAGLFDGCEKQPNWEYMSNSRIFAIIRDGQAVSSVCCDPIGTKAPSGRQVIALGGLYTETPYRQKGLGKQVVSYATEMTLANNNVPMYWTEHDNWASQALCKSLGYSQYARNMVFMWRKSSAGSESVK